MLCSGNVLENHLRQRIVLLEDSLARLASTRKELHNNVDVVKNEVRLSFGHQLSRLRHREQQILEKLDTVASVKDGILSQQQDQLHQALGACTQGLEWLQTAFEDVKTNRLTTIETVEQKISDILNKLSSMEIMPRETAHISFEADPVALRRAISSFGQVRSSSAPRHCESLPCGLEDYEDEESVNHNLLHKTVYGSTRPITTVTFGRPKLSTDPKDCLMKEALTGQPSKESNFDATCEAHCNAQSKRQDQVHNWLHQIKNLVENEPAVFEDFEIIKKRMSSSGNQGETDLSFDVLFRPYFDMVLNSPAQQWLLFGKNQTDQLNEVENRRLNQRDMDNGDDMESCNSSFTFNSDASFVHAGNATVDNVNEKSFVDEYSEFWSQFLKKLWSSSDSMWLLPCASTQPLAVVEDEDESPVTVDYEFITEAIIGGSRKKECGGKLNHGSARIDTTCKTFDASSGWLLNETPPKNLASQRKTETNGDFLPSIFDKLKFEEFPTKADYDQWLFRPKSTSLTDEPINHYSHDVRIYEDVLGWKSVLEKVHGLGDEQWLYRPSSFNVANTNVGETSKFGYPFHLNIGN